ncbi:hypothetical protein DAI22_11g220500 [Oryza sativa Japonica Group]|nr:hypothetical protein DAI22_11g220500 [Oryza sativa Japonica Group]
MGCGPWVADVVGGGRGSKVRLCSTAAGLEEGGNIDFVPRSEERGEAHRLVRESERGDGPARVGWPTAGWARPSRARPARAGGADRSLLDPVKRGRRARVAATLARERERGGAGPEIGRLTARGGIRRAAGNRSEGTAPGARGGGVDPFHRRGLGRRGQRRAGDGVRLAAAATLQGGPRGHRDGGGARNQGEEGGRWLGRHGGSGRSRCTAERGETEEWNAAGYVEQRRARCGERGGEEGWRLQCYFG